MLKIKGTPVKAKNLQHCKERRQRFKTVNPQTGCRHSLPLPQGAPQITFDLNEPTESGESIYTWVGRIQRFSWLDPQNRQNRPQTAFCTKQAAQSRGNTKKCTAVETQKPFRFPNRTQVRTRLKPTADFQRNVWGSKA